MLGTGILKGLYITAKNLVGSYYSSERLTTIQYPEQRAQLPENYRNFPFLVYDGEDAIDGLRCTACKMCEKECPPQCIYIIPERDEKGKLQKKPKVFDIDISVCMGCGICAEVCPFESIKMDHHFEVAQRNRFAGLLLHREQLAKSNKYYHSIRPKEATAVDESLAEEKRKAEEKAKAAAAAKEAAAKAAAAKAADAAKAKTDDLEEKKN
ncbi:MAG: 4Fe-4S dicluster domain-containing protein [Puniceicoccales bacterium]|jgi:NADH-quinone oxidoreductase subunit I|nr:4Fe-4S dicluster domain-containing protein [Puniceicoccales bacterium]